MDGFLYFAYGSNMLTARLRERCPSAQPRGLASAEGYVVAFRKEGMDGSGKATLAACENGAGAPGVLYRIHMGERADLDRAEGRYRREDALAVLCKRSGKTITACTYIAEPGACRTGLVPFDWYLALMRAGAIEHGLDADYIAWLIAVETRKDSDLRRAARMAALAESHF